MDVNWVLIGAITLGWLVFLIITITWLSRTALRRNIFASAGRKMMAVAMPLSLLIGTLAGALAYAAYGRQLSYVAGAFYIAHGVSFVLLVMGLMSLHSPALEAPVLTTFQKRWTKVAQDCGLGVQVPYYLRLGHKHARDPSLRSMS